MRVYVWHFSVLTKIKRPIASHVIINGIKMLIILKFYRAVLLENIPTKEQIRSDITCDRCWKSLLCKMYYEEDFGWKINDENISVVINCLALNFLSFPDAWNRIFVRIEEALYLSLLICLTDIIKVCCLQLSRSTSWIAITSILLQATACLERGVFKRKMFHKESQCEDILSFSRRKTIEKVTKVLGRLLLFYRKSIMIQSEGRRKRRAAHFHK